MYVHKKRQDNASEVFIVTLRDLSISPSHHPSTPSVAALTAQWAAAHGNNDIAGGSPHHGSISSNLLSVPASSAAAAIAGAAPAPPTNSATVAITSPPQQNQNLETGATGATGATPMIYDYPAKGTAVFSIVLFLSMHYF